MGKMPIAKNYPEIWKVSYDPQPMSGREKRNNHKVEYAATLVRRAEKLLEVPFGVFLNKIFYKDAVNDMIKASMLYDDTKAEQEIQLIS